RSAIDLHRRNRGEALEQFTPELQQAIVRGFVGIQAQRYRLSFARAHAIDHYTVARRKVRYLVEKYARTFFGVIQHLSDGADVFLGIRALNSFQLAQGIYDIKPLPQVAPAPLGRFGFYLLSHLFASS